MNSPSVPRVTLKEVAKRAGVSVISVSRALNGQPKVSESNRRRILEVCREVGYVAQPQISAAMRFVRTRGIGNYNGNLGYILSLPAGPSPELRGVSRRAAELGYGVDVVSVVEARSRKRGARLSEIFWSRGVRGVILGQLPRPLGHLSLKWSQFAFVAIGYTQRRPALHRVCSDLTGGAQVAYRSLWRLGYRRIAFVSSVNYIRRANYLFLSGFAGWHLHFHPDRPLLTWSWDKWDPRAFLRWFRKTRPHCILCSPEAQPFHCLRDAGVDIPGEAGFAVLDVEAFPGSPFSGLDQRREEFAASAVDKVVGLLNTGSFGLPDSPMITLLENVWRDGPTTRQR